MCKSYSLDFHNGFFFFIVRISSELDPVDDFVKIDVHECKSFGYIFSFEYRFHLDHIVSTYIWTGSLITKLLLSLAVDHVLGMDIVSLYYFYRT